MRIRRQFQPRTAVVAIVAVALILPGLTAEASRLASGSSARGKLFLVGKGPRAYPDLQAAVDAAQDGDLVLVTIDTCGASVNKRLYIHGTGAGTVFGMVNPSGFCGTRTDFASAIDLGPDASGTRIFNLKISNAFIGIVANMPDDGSSAANDIEISNSTLSDVQIGVHARRADGWTVEKNTIILSSSVSGAAQAMLLTDGVDNWIIRENVITGVVNGDAFGIDVLAVAACPNNVCSFAAEPITNLWITGNVIAVTSSGRNAPSIRLAAKEADIDTVEVTGNDLSGSDRRVLVQAGVDPADTNDDLSSLHQYDFNLISGWESVIDLLSQGNLHP